MNDDRMFSFYWFLTFLFWVFSGLIAVCGEIATGIVMMFAGPPVSFIITALVFSAMSLLRGKPSEKTAPVRRRAEEKTVPLRRKAAKRNSSPGLPETGDRPDDGPGETGIRPGDDIHG